MFMTDENTEVVETNQIQDGRPEQEDIHTHRKPWENVRLELRVLVASRAHIVERKRRHHT